MNQIATIIRRHWMPLLGLNNVLLAATCAATIYASTNSQPVWTASAQLNLPVTTADLNADLGTLGSLTNSRVGFSKELNPLELQSYILTSDVVIDRVWAFDPEKNLYPSLSNYKKLFEVAPKDQSTIISLKAEASSPELARKRVANLIQVYQQRLNELRRNDNDTREQFAQEELEKSRRDLNQAQTALTSFQQATGLTNISEQTKGLIASIGALKTTQATVMAEAQANEAQSKVEAARLSMTPEQAMNSLRLVENQEYQAIREKVSLVETALAEARGKFTQESPQVQSLLLQRQELLRERDQRFTAVIPYAIPQEVETTLGSNGSTDSRVNMIAELIRTETIAKGLQQQALQLQNQVNKLNSELSFISKNQAQLTDLQRKYEIAEGVYKGIMAQFQQSKTSPFNTYPNVQTINESTIDPKPSEPKLWLIALGGTLASIFGSIALVLFLEARKPLLGAKDLQQVEFPVMGRISRLKRPDMERYLEAEIDVDFQRLAAAVSCLVLQNNRLMVTSATSGEGKTTVTLGLALALVNLGFRVLVVDGDLRQAQMSRRLKRPHSEVTNSKQMVCVYPGLDLLPALPIPKNKIGEFFARGSFEQHLSTVQDSGSYDYVLVDSAPVGLATETSLMSEVVRNVLFVVRPGTSDRYSVMDGVEQFMQHNAQIKGLVVNGVESRTEGYRYRYQPELLATEA